MIEDALLEAQKLDEGAVMNTVKAAGNMIKNAFSGGSNNGNGNNANANNGDANNQNTDQSEEQPKEAADPGIDKIKEYVNDNPDVSDWPADRLGELVAFLKTQKDFMNSKTAQQNLQTIQQAEQKAEAEGKTEAPADGGKGDPSKVPDGDLTTVMSRLQGLTGGNYSAEDLAAAINQKLGKK